MIEKPKLGGLQAKYLPYSWFGCRLTRPATLAQLCLPAHQFYPCWASYSIIFGLQWQNVYLEQWWNFVTEVSQADQPKYLFLFNLLFYITSYICKSLWQKYGSIHLWPVEYIRMCRLKANKNHHSFIHSFIHSMYQSF